MSELIKLIESENSERRKHFPKFKAGDMINVHVNLKEGNKERIQQFQGTVIQRRNAGSNGETFTVRKISSGVGVERIFPILSPNLVKIEVIKTGAVRRKRLFYLRDLSGKAAKIKEGKLQAKDLMAEVNAYEKMLKEQEEAAQAAKEELAAKEAAEAAAEQEKQAAQEQAEAKQDESPKKESEEQKPEKQEVEENK